MKAKSIKCGHEYDHDGWPEDELCPDCYFEKMDTDELHYAAEAARECFADNSRRVTHDQQA